MESRDGKNIELVFGIGNISRSERNDALVLIRRVAIFRCERRGKIKKLPKKEASLQLIYILLTKHS